MRRQQGLSSRHSSCVHWGTQPICKQSTPWYITRLLWRALFLICTTERALIKCIPVSSIWIVMANIFLYYNSVEACATCVGLTLKQIYIPFAFELAIFLFLRSGRGERVARQNVVWTQVLVFWGKSPGKVFWKREARHLEGEWTNSCLSKSSRLIILGSFSQVATIQTHLQPAGSKTITPVFVSSVNC